MSETYEYEIIVYDAINSKKRHIKSTWTLKCGKDYSPTSNALTFFNYVLEDFNAELFFIGVNKE